MAHISSISSGIFTDLSVAAVPGDIPSSAAEYPGLFTTEIPLTEASPVTTEFVRFKNITSLPRVCGTVKMISSPVYGVDDKRNVKGQSENDAMAVEMAYISADWNRQDSVLGRIVGSKKKHVFRLTLLNREPDGYGNNQLASVENSIWYWVGRISSASVKSGLSGANTITVSLLTSSDFTGPVTAGTDYGTFQLFDSLGSALLDSTSDPLQATG